MSNPEISPKVQKLLDARSRAWERLQEAKADLEAAEQQYRDANAVYHAEWDPILREHNDREVEKNRERARKRRRR